MDKQCDSDNPLMVQQVAEDRHFNGRKGIGKAVRLEQITLAWMVIEAAVSLFAAASAGSVLLLAFGTDSVIEIISAGVLYFRLTQESSGVSEEMTEAAEHRASQIAGGLLFLLAAYIVAQSVYSLIHRHAAHRSWLGIAVAVIAALGMPVLARAKIRVAEQIGSTALKADAMESITCGYLSWLLLVGLAANAALHWWWLDSACALVLVPILLKEGWEAVSGRCCCQTG